MAERLEAASGDQNGDFVRLKTEKPRSLCGIQPCRWKLPTQELCLCRIHDIWHRVLPGSALVRVFVIHEITPELLTEKEPVTKLPGYVEGFRLRRWQAAKVYASASRIWARMIFRIIASG